MTARFAIALCFIAWMPFSIFAQINPNNKNQYRFDDKWVDLEETTVKLKVKMGGIVLPIKKKAYWSKYGATVRTDKGTFSVRYGASQDIRGMEQWYRMDKSRNFSEFYKAMEMVAIPMFNTVYADRYDTIFYVSNAKIPIRAKGYDWKNTVIGNTSKTLTTGFHPLKDLPQYVNPKSGYVFNTNNTPFNASGASDNLTAANFDETMGYETADNNRSLRFQELMGQFDKLSYADFKRIKYDNQLPKKLAYLANVDALFQLKPDDYPTLKPLIQTIQKWDKKADADSKGAAAFAVFFYKIVEKYKTTEGGYNRVIDKEECVEILNYTKDYLLKNFGKTDIALGDMQKLVRGKNEQPVWGLPDVLTAMYSQPYKNGQIKAAQGESYIELVKFPKNRLPEIESVINYGASNHLESPHYADQMPLYLNKQTKKMSLDKAQVLKEAVRVYHPK
jgi:acyl-homoserine-lactone acylase